MDNLYWDRGKSASETKHDKKANITSFILCKGVRNKIHNEKLLFYVVNMKIFTFFKFSPYKKAKSTIQC